MYIEYLHVICILLDSRIKNSFGLRVPACRPLLSLNIQCRARYLDTDALKTLSRKGKFYQDKGL